MKLLPKTSAALLGLGLALAATSAVAAPLQTATARAADASISVTPSTDLPPTADVTVSGGGLEAGGQYYVLQCGVLDSTTNDWSCDPNTRVQITPDDSGDYDTPLTVNSQFVGTRSDGESAPVDCAQIQCVVTVATPDGQGVVNTPISFA